MDQKLLSILVCPVCKGSLKYDKKAGGTATDTPGIESSTESGKESSADSGRDNVRRLGKISGELICFGDGLAYPIRDGIPVMLSKEARLLTLEEREKR
ncbi:MAG: Trm112 family protein [Pseudohongiellaceae bacterium]